MTLTDQTSTATAEHHGPGLTPEELLGHSDTVTSGVAAELSALLAGVEVEVGPSQAQEDPSDLAPGSGVHGVMVSLSGGPVINVAVVVDDELHALFGAGDGDGTDAPPAWLAAASKAVDSWARPGGSVVVGALPIDRPAELDHLATAGGDVSLVAAGLFHQGRHAGTVAVLGHVAPTGSSRAESATVPDARSASGGAGPQAAALRALADVEMTVTAELGRARMSVSDLLDLGPGSVIELDRTAGSPIDLLVNGTLVARGEVVVIDEEYGVRLTEVVGSDEA